MPYRLVFDIEGNGLLDTVTKVHCIEAVDPDTRETFSFGPDRIRQGLELLSKADLLIAHYGIGYDFPALEKVEGFFVPHEKQHDTVVTSRLMFPNLKATDTLGGKLRGNHSIEAWGERLGRPKLHTDIEDWSTWTPQMQERCAGDAMTNVDLLLYLDPDNYSQSAIELEHRVARLLIMMERAGVPFNEREAAKLHVELLAARERIEEELIATYGYWYQPKKTDAHGIPETFTPKKNDKKRGYTADHPMTHLKKVTFNPRSNAHCVKQLKKLGWVPDSFTPSGEPELTEEVLETIAKFYPDAGKIVQHRILNKRLSMLVGEENGKKDSMPWMKAADNEGLIHGRMNPMGTPHSRASHFKPNLAQVPKNSKPYGKQCRALFGAGHRGDGWVQVGADMSGLQQRALGHYLTPMDGGAYGKMVATEDIHWVYAQAATLIPEGTKRDKADPLHEIIRETGAKPFGYAYLFGCFPKKSGEVVKNCCIIARQKGFPELYERFFGTGKSPTQVGNEVRKEFDERLSLGKLNTRLAYNFKLPGKWTGHIKGLDGRWVPCRSAHSLLNYALSSAEAIICKTWLVDVYEAMIARGLRFGWDGDFVIMLWVHDEIQVAVRKGLEQEVGELIIACAKRAGEKLGFRVPLASEYKVGSNWAACH